MAVVGVVVQDRVEMPDGTVATGLGGLAYSVGALANLGRHDVDVVPICRVADDTRESVELEWTPYDNVAADALVAWRGPGSCVELVYRDGGLVGGDRDECLRWPTPPLDAPEIEAIADCDAVLVNCITGAVLTPAALRALAALPIPVHLDVHSLVLGIDAEGRRFPARPADWRSWLEAADTIQCNEQEAAILAGEHEWNRAVAGFVRGLVDSRIGPREVLITRGARGASLYRPETAPAHIAAPEVQVVDPTGAGDTLGAAFVCERLMGSSTEMAVRRAVVAASAACGLRGTRALRGLASA